MIYKLTFSGVPSAKKNSKRTIYRGGRKFVVPSENHEAWHNNCQGELWNQKKYLPRETLPFVELIEIRYFVPDLKERDADNCTTSVLDFLVDMKIITNDDMRTIKEQRSISGGLDVENPRTEIVIHT